MHRCILWALNINALLHKLHPVEPHAATGPELLRAVLDRETQQVVAGKLGVHQSTLSRWASEKFVPSPRFMKRLRDQFGIPIDAWIEEGDEKSPEAAA
jgi:hypothetical protein